jgi:hypothetical protein
MKYGIRAVLLVAAAISLSSFTVFGSQQNERGQSSPGAASKQETQTIPPYHKTAKDAKPLPRLLPPSTFSDRPLVARAYQIASEIPFVLAQQPCYCHCDKAFGHSSLLDCFASSHTAGCGICMAETSFAFQMTKQGKTPAEIREAIIRGGWKKADTQQSK